MQIEELSSADFSPSQLSGAFTIEVDPDENPRFCSLDSSVLGPVFFLETTLDDNDTLQTVQHMWSSVPIDVDMAPLLRRAARDVEDVRKIVIKGERPGWVMQPTHEFTLWLDFEIDTRTIPGLGALMLERLVFHTNRHQQFIAGVDSAMGVSSPARAYGHYYG